MPYDRLRVARSIEDLITEMLKTYGVKLWVRAYMNLGLIARFRDTIDSYDALPARVLPLLTHGVMYLPVT